MASVAAAATHPAALTLVEVHPMFSVRRNLEICERLHFAAAEEF